LQAIGKRNFGPGIQIGIALFSPTFVHRIQIAMLFAEFCFCSGKIPSDFSKSE
jgi:hypothetical protein